MKDSRVPKHIWLPVLLLLYMLVMTFYFGRDLIATHQITRLVITCGAELLIIVGVFFSLRSKARLAEKRKNENVR